MEWKKKASHRLRGRLFHADVLFFPFRLFPDGALKVLEELLTEKIERDLVVRLALVRHNLVGIEKIVRAALIDIEEEVCPAIVGDGQDDIGIGCLGHAFLVNLRGLTAVERRVLTASGCTCILSKIIRSEERRVGKECRSRWSPYH